MRKNRGLSVTEEESVKIDREEDDDGDGVLCSGAAEIKQIENQKTVMSQAAAS